MRPTKQESKADATDRAARAIILEEQEERQAKTDRLRAARLEKRARERSAQASSKGEDPERA